MCSYKSKYFSRYILFPKATTDDEKIRSSPTQALRNMNEMADILYSIW